MIPPALVPAAINAADNPLSLEFYRILLQNFLPAAGPAVVALVVTVALVWPVRRLSFRVGAVAQPGGRNIHERPTARLGGVAMAAGFTVAAFIFTVVWPQGRDTGFGTSQVLILIGLGLATTAIMAFDDARQLRAGVKFVNQVVIAVAAVVLGIAITSVNLGGGHVIQLGMLAIPVTIVWLVGMQNTMNLLDGVDGLAGGVAAIVAIALLLAAVNREQHEASQFTIVLLCAAFIGACAGFLLFNFNPARVFMGDSGSHFLGVVLGILSVFGIAKGEVVFALLVPVAALAIPIADTAWAIVRRRRQRISIGHADTAHVHHQLLDFGLSQRQTCLVFYCATGITSGLGLMLYGHRKILAVVVVLLVVGLSTLLGDRLHEIESARLEPRLDEHEARSGDSGVLLES
jgi:UDP-GlcNAc:undecaprenyl-phosphate GlcNAc-1-phosphate transferase